VQQIRERGGEALREKGRGIWETQERDEEGIRGRESVLDYDPNSYWALDTPWPILT
jgi:hypothetical protein